MKVDLEKMMAEAVQSILPWDLVMTIRGRDHRVRPLMVADVVALANLEHQRDAGKTLEVVAGFFEEPKPDVSQWSVQEVMLVINTIAVQHGEHTRKNSVAVAAFCKNKASATGEKNDKGPALPN